MFEDKNKKASEELDKVNGLYRLSKLLGASGGLLIMFGCILLLVLCMITGNK